MNIVMQIILFFCQGLNLWFKDATYFCQGLNVGMNLLSSIFINYKL
jgi:hypothetical protein